MKRLLMTTALIASAISSPAYADMLFTVPFGVKDGHMNMRTGPGSNHSLIGMIPQGQRVTASRCVPRDDGIAGADWCLVDYAGMRGWVARSGLMPYQAEAAAPPPTPYEGEPPLRRGQPVSPDYAPATPQIELEFTRAFVCLPTQDGKDRNPPVRLHVEVDLDGDLAASRMRVVYDLWNGQIADRAKQYSAKLNTSKEPIIYSWSGVYNRDPSKTMVAALYYGDDHHWYYREKQVDRGFTNYDQTFPCKRIERTTARF